MRKYKNKQFRSLSHNVLDLHDKPSHTQTHHNLDKVQLADSLLRRLKMMRLISNVLLTILRSLPRTTFEEARR